MGRQSNKIEERSIFLNSYEKNSKFTCSFYLSNPYIFNIDRIEIMAFRNKVYSWPSLKHINTLTFVRIHPLKSIFSLITPTKKERKENLFQAETKNIGNIIETLIRKILFLVHQYASSPLFKSLFMGSNII